MNKYLDDHRETFNTKLSLLLPAQDNHASNLHCAMRYSMLNGGKRIRPLLCIAAADAIAENNSATFSVAAAIEMMHVYSLIHDDLPSMDNDDLRRGKPTCHVKFNEATAILAGDALQALAFETIADIGSLTYQNHIRLVKILAANIGCSGMVKGQAIDLDCSATNLNQEQLDEMHNCKTGALIEASIIMGAITTQKMSDAQEESLKIFAKKIGLAFQIQDDILDVESSTEEMGKSRGSDVSNKKSTYTSLLGLSKSKDRASSLYKESIEALEVFEHKADPLRVLANFIISRTY